MADKSGVRTGVVRAVCARLGAGILAVVLDFPVGHFWRISLPNLKKAYKGNTARLTA